MFAFAALLLAYYIIDRCLHDGTDHPPHEHRARTKGSDGARSSETLRSPPSRRASRFADEPSTSAIKRTFKHFQDYLQGNVSDVAEEAQEESPSFGRAANRVNKRRHV